MAARLAGMETAVILEGARSPIGNFLGSLLSELVVVVLGPDAVGITGNNEEAP